MNFEKKLENKEFKNIIEKLDFHSLFALHLFFSLSKQNKGKIEVVLGTLKALSSGNIGNSIISNKQLEKLKEIKFILDDWEYKKNEIIINKKKYMYIGKTNIAGFESICKFLKIFNLEEYYKISDNFLKKVNIDDFWDIYNKIDLLIYGGNIKYKKLVLNNKNKKYFSITPYSIAGYLENFNYWPWKNNILKISNNYFEKISGNSMKIFTNKNYIHDRAISNKIFHNGSICLSSKEVYSFINRYNEKKLNNVIAFLKNNALKIKLDEFSIFGIYKMMVSLNANENMKLKNFSVLPIPWEFENIYWDEEEKLNAFSNIIENTSLIKWLCYESKDFKVKERIFRLVKSNLIEFVNIFKKNKLIINISSDKFEALVQTITHIMSNPNIENFFIKFSIKNDNLIFSFDSKIIEFDFYDFIINITKQKKLLKLLNPNCDWTDYKPSNVEIAIENMPFKDETNEEAQERLNYAMYFIKLLNKKIGSKVTEESTDLENGLKIVNNKLKEIIKKIKKVNREQLIYWVDIHSKLALTIYDQSLQYLSKIPITNMENDEKEKGMNFFITNRKSALSIFRALKFISFISNVDNKKNSKNKINIDILAEIIELMNSKYARQLSLEYYKHRNQKMNLDDDGIFFNFSLDDKKIIGSKDKEILSKQKKEEFATIVIQIIEKGFRKEKIPDHSLGLDKLLNEAIIFSNKGYPVYVENSDKYDLFFYYFNKIWIYEIYNNVFPSIPLIDLEISKIKDIFSKGFENYIYNILINEFDETFEIKKNYFFKKQDREFDIVIFKQNIIITIECKYFFNAKNTKDIINRYSAEAQKIEQRKKQLEYLKIIFPSQKSYVILVSNKKTNNNLFFHYSDFVNEIKKILSHS